MASKILVFDASPLIHFARADELVTLREIVAGFKCVTTKAVRGELGRGVVSYTAIQNALELDWIATVSCDELEELYLFADYMNKLGNLERNAGEASALAWAEAHSAAAYVDDQLACNIGRSRGVRVHRTLQLVIEAYRVGVMGESKAQKLIQDLADVDARFPAAARDDLFRWARSRNPPLL